MTDSRSLRVVVARGSIAYSPVTQPSPDPLRQRGTPLVTDAVHSTLVSPKATSTDPSACMDHCRWKDTGRSSSFDRPSTLLTAQRLRCAGCLVEVAVHVLLADAVDDPFEPEHRQLCFFHPGQTELHAVLGPPFDQSRDGRRPL